MKTQTLLTFLLSVFVTSMVEGYPVSEMVLGVNADGTLQFPVEHVLNAQEIELANLIAKHAEQQRTTLRVSALGCMIARMRSEDRINRAYYAHIDPDGNAPSAWGRNELRLGSEIIVGRSTMEWAVQSFYESQPHREAMLGENGRTELYIGVGVLERVSVVPYDDLYDPGRVYKSYIVTVIFYFSQRDIGRKVYAPDGTDLSNVNMVEAQTRVGLQGLTPAPDNQWHSQWFGDFVDVGAGYLRHESLGLLYHDVEAVDTTHTLSTVPHIIDGSSYWPFEYIDSTRGVSNQGFQFRHPEHGWLWTHPQTYPYVFKRDTQSWFRVDHQERRIGLSNPVVISEPTGTVTDLATGEVQVWNDPESEEQLGLTFADNQVYVGDDVALVWNSNAQAAITANVNSEPFGVFGTTGAYSWQAQSAGTYMALADNGVATAQADLEVLPAPQAVPTLWLDAAPRTVQPGEPFVLAWVGFGDVEPQVIGTSYGLVSNDQQGVNVFTRTVPGDYEFKIRVGSYEQTLTVTVEGDLLEYQDR
jgi:hypothetical protein